MATSKSHTLSRALASKLSQQKALAPDLLPKTRWCAAVVLAMATDQDVEASISQLKTGLGSNWSPVAAFQYMSGQQALLSAECAGVQDKGSLLLAQRIAAAVFRELGKGKLSASALPGLAAKHARLEAAIPRDSVPALGVP